VTAATTNNRDNQQMATTNDRDNNDLDNNDLDNQQLQQPVIMTTNNWDNQ